MLPPVKEQPVTVPAYGPIGRTGFIKTGWVVKDELPAEVLEDEILAEEEQSGLLIEPLK